MPHGEPHRLSTFRTNETHAGSCWAVLAERRDLTLFGRLWAAQRGGPGRQYRRSACTRRSELWLRGTLRVCRRSRGRRAAVGVLRGSACRQRCREELPEHRRAGPCRRESGPGGAARAQHVWGGMGTAWHDAGSAWERTGSAPENHIKTGTSRVHYSESARVRGAVWRSRRCLSG